MDWPPPRLRTARLLLRKPGPADAQAIFERLSGDAGVTRHLGWLTHVVAEQTRQQVSLDLLRWNRGAAWTWLIEHENEVVGMIQLSLIAPHLLRAGCMMAHSHQRRGLMTEAMQTVINAAFRQAAFHRIEALCDVDNLASARMLERSGMRREGLLASYIIHPNLSPLPRDALLFACCRSEAGDNPQNTPARPP